MQGERRASKPVRCAWWNARVIRETDSSSQEEDVFIVVCAYNNATLVCFAAQRASDAIMSSRRSSTLQTILSNYFFNDPSDVRCSPLTSVNATEAQSKDVAASADPLDRSALIARLQTFQ